MGQLCRRRGARRRLKEWLRRRREALPLFDTRRLTRDVVRAGPQLNPASVLGPFGSSRASPGVVSQTAEPRLRRRLAAGLAAACPVRDERYFITHKAEAAARCGSACGVPRQFASACLLVFLPLLLSGWWWAWGEQERGMMGMWDVYAAGAPSPSPPPPLRARAPS